MPPPVIAATLQDPLAQTLSQTAPPAAGAVPLHIHVTLRDNGSSSYDKQTGTLQLSRNADTDTMPSNSAPKMSQTDAICEAAPKPSSSGWSGLDRLNRNNSRNPSGSSGSTFQNRGAVTYRSGAADAMAAIDAVAPASQNSAASGTAVTTSGTSLLSLQDCCCKASELKDRGPWGG
ncbi:hypothetical protein Vafri_17774 [Volvox africanus]|uniref:Uncharacterized protein n=1 Tax=Volvox africanus TaxID=51714 RepID=A0A8J4BLS9_9CHLO|nr:hypothetical protein Vafri_17774 [Volvox africanus]